MGRSPKCWVVNAYDRTGTRLMADRRLVAIQGRDDPLVIEQTQLAAYLLQLALKGDEQFPVIEQDPLQTPLDSADGDRAQRGRERFGRNLPLH